jgi:hypothetical protein
VTTHPLSTQWLVSSGFDRSAIPEPPCPLHLHYSLFFFFWDWVLLYSLDWLRTHHIAQAGLKLTILGLEWDYRYALPHSAYSLLFCRAKLRSPPILSLSQSRVGNTRLKGSFIKVKGSRQKKTSFFCGTGVWTQDLILSRRVLPKFFHWKTKQKQTKKQNKHFSLTHFRMQILRNIWTFLILGCILTVSDLPQSQMAAFVFF